MGILEGGGLEPGPFQGSGDRTFLCGRQEGPVQPALDHEGIVEFGALQVGAGEIGVGQIGA